MDKLYKYNHFLLEKEFNSIVDEIYRIVESDGKWTGDKTYEWDLTESKLKKFLSKLSKEEIRNYFIKLLNKLKSLPEKIKKFLTKNFTKIFLTYVSYQFLLMSPVFMSNKTIDEDTKNYVLEISKNMVDSTASSAKFVDKKSSFEKAQKLVKLSEKGYSSDKKDRGNYIKTKKGKIFIGTNHGIAAPTLKEYLGRIPTQEDMKNLSYQEALKIFKKRYWDHKNLSYFSDQSVANIIYDGCVNQGNGKMNKIFKTVLNENGIELDSTDNPFDVKLIQMANQLDQEKLFNDIKSEREKRYRDSKTWKRHGVGWLKRLNSLTYNTTTDQNNQNEA